MKFILFNIALFIILSVVIYFFQQSFPAYNFMLMMSCNILMSVLSLISWLLIQRQIRKRPQAFVRGIYGATFLKLMACTISLVVYVMLHRKEIHKPSLFLLFGIYACYTAVETILLSKLARTIK